jgi:large repetitive protein
MAKFARVNGDLLPVLNDDSGQYVNSGPNAVQAGATVQPQGPALAFFTVTGVGALTGTQATYAIRATEQLATIHIYQFNNAANDSLAMAIYPIDAWNISDLQANVRASLTALGQPNAVTVTAGATFSEITYPPTGPIAPAAPVIGTAIATAATTATVNFTPQYDGGSAITSFNVVSVPAGGTGSSTSPTATSVAVTGLTTGTDYVFVVTATNAIGTSVPSDPSNQVTTP